MSNLMEINDVRGFIDDKGTAHLNLEDVARGLGFTQVAKSGNESIRWERVVGYLDSFGIPTCGDGIPEFIPENIFYRLAFKAKNKVAEDFQTKVCDEILPTIRKTGSYTLNDVMPLLDTITKRLEVSEERNEKLQQCVDKINDNIAIRRYVDPKAMLKALDVRYGVAVGTYYTRGFYNSIANYLGIPIPNSCDVPKGMHLWEYIIAKLPMDFIESFVIGVEHETIVMSNENNWINLNGYLADRQWEKILEGFGHKCAYCGKDHYESTLLAEHIVPFHKISETDPCGCNLISNIVPACSDCNYSKYTNPMEEWFRKQSFFTEEKLQIINDHIKKYER